MVWNTRVLVRDLSLLSGHRHMIWANMDGTYSNVEDFILSSCSSILFAFSNFKEYCSCLFQVSVRLSSRQRDSGGFSCSIFFFQRKIGLLLIQCNKGTVSPGGTNSHFLAQRWRQVSYKNNSAICGYCCILELVPLGGGLERDCLRTKAAQCSQDWLIPWGVQWNSCTTAKITGRVAGTAYRNEL